MSKNRIFTKEEELKFYLLSNGIKISKKAEMAWHEKFQGPISLSEYASTSGVCIYTENNVYINAPFVEEFTQSTEASLEFEEKHSNKSGFYVNFQHENYPVQVIPVPSYHQESYCEDGINYPYTNLGVTHTDRVRISPIEGCAWVCKFCDLPFEKRYRKKPMDQLLRVIELAKDDKLSPARHVLISGGTPKPEDEGWIDEVYEYIAANSPIPVDVMMPARKNMSYPKWLRSTGVNMVSINIEVFDEERAKKIIPSKARHLGLSHYLNYIEKAVEAFGVGYVQSLVVFGKAIEPLESSLKAVEALAQRGCIPVLSAFRPDFTTPMGKEEPASLEDMKYILTKAEEICLNSGTGIKPGPRCIACQHNTVVFPDDSNFYVNNNNDTLLARPNISSFNLSDELCA